MTDKKTLSKKLRLYTWLISGLVKRHGKVVGLSFVLGIALVVMIMKLAPQLKQLVYHGTVMGLVGAYSPSDLPESVGKLVSFGLTEISESGEAKPALATSWEIDSTGKEYTFHLRNDVFWHDKKKFTAYDVNYNLKDVEFVPTSETELKVKLKEPFSPLVTFLAKPLFRKGLVGVGPYKITSLRLKGDTVSYIKLMAVSGKFQTIEVKFYPSEAVLKTAFKLGEVTTIFDVTDPTSFIGWKNTSVEMVDRRNQIVTVFFNLNNSLLKEKEIRQALAYAFDKPEKNRVATPLANKSWAYTNRVKQYEKDVATANKLLADIKKSSDSAGLILSTFASHLPLAQIIASSWESVGIPTKVKVETGMPQTFDVLLAIQEIPYDPDEYSIWHSTQTVNNITHYGSPKIDKLLEDGRKEIDMEKRKKIYYDFQRYLVEDAPAIFLNHPTTYTIGKR